MRRLYATRYDRGNTEDFKKNRHVPGGVPNWFDREGANQVVGARVNADLKGSTSPSFAAPLISQVDMRLASYKATDAAAVLFKFWFSVAPGELAAWLGLKTNELDWFADRNAVGRIHSQGPLQHYRYYWLSKRLAGTARLIEAPKWRLKTIQKQILHGILDRIPPHATAHGFRRGRSIKTYVAPHVGHSVLIRIDLQDFFPSVARARAAGVFRVAGYPEEVVQILASLCTNEIPEEVWEHFPAYGGVTDRMRHESLYCRPHLPQGAPTSPALANLSAFRLDCRLDGLAHSVDAQYTRYADDLLFSGSDKVARSARRLLTSVGAIAIEEGFKINDRKTRVMFQGRRQHAAGLVVNQTINTPRVEFDRLKATLFNCVRNGPVAENRQGLPYFRAHLEGRVAHIESVNPNRGQRLRAILQAIDWS